MIKILNVGHTFDDFMTGQVGLGVGSWASNRMRDRLQVNVIILPDPA